jgi:hypothetical protein
MTSRKLKLECRTAFGRRDWGASHSSSLESRRLKRADRARFAHFLAETPAPLVLRRPRVAFADCEYENGIGPGWLSFRFRDALIDTDRPIYFTFLL